LGVPQASYRLPQTPNYGAYPSPQVRYTPQPDGVAPSRSRATGTSPRSQAEIDYKNDTGYWPQEDPNFNTMLYESYGGRVSRRPYARMDVINDYPPEPVDVISGSVEDPDSFTFWQNQQPVG